MNEAIGRMGAKPIERGANVVVRELEAIETSLLVHRALRAGVLNQRFIVGGVSFANRVRSRVRFQLFDGERANRLEHPEPLIAKDEETLVDERRDRVQRRFAHAFGRFDREFTGERP